MKTGQTLRFSKGITIIYGENGSGKSGYARIMKKAFRARVIEDILPNVYIPSPASSASAIYDFQENDQEVSETWTDGEETSERFGRFAVLDAKCARFIINSESVLEFLPYGFELFTDLAKITDEIKGELIQFGIDKRPNPYELKLLLDQTSYGIFVSSLTASTKLTEVESRANFSAEDSQALTNYAVELRPLENSSPDAIRKQLQGEKKTIEAVKKQAQEIINVVSDESLDQFIKAHQKVESLEKAVKVSSSGLKQEEDLNGVGSEIWRALLKAAERYSFTEAYPEVPFPANVEGAKCVLCQQPLSDVAQERLERFWKFIADETALKLDAAKADLAIIQERIRREPRGIPVEIQGLEHVFQNCGENVFEALSAFYNEVGKRVKAVEDFSAGAQWEVANGALLSPILVCDSGISTIDQKLGALKDDQAVNNRISWLKSQISEIEAKERFTKSKDLLVKHLAAIKLSSKAQTEGRKNNTRRITEKAKALQEELVTEDFRKRVATELGGLVQPGLKASIVDKPGKGRLFFRVEVPTSRQVSPEAIFSEGERTAVALACFLAELASSQDNCGIVFDDPVSSFDHKIRKKVVDRLVQESKVRQVIVFTHDLVFLTELMQSINRHQLDHIVQVAESYEGVIGLLSDGVPWEAVPVTRRLQILEEWVGDSKKAVESGDIQRSKLLLDNVASKLRSTWERAVEELLFNKVVERYARDVETLRLSQVGIDDESVEMVFDGMSAASKLLPGHDAPAGENRPALTSSLLLKEISKLREFIEKQKQKNRTAEKRREHLKKKHAFK